MYTDGVITNEFTGYYDADEGEYISPSAKQTATILFDGWYLSSEDLTTDGLTISSETGNSEDITIGNAPAKVLMATMLNPSGLMEGLTWGEGAVYIGVETASAAADTYASLPVHVLVGSTHYGINASGNARRGSTVYTLGGTPVAVISNADGTDVLFITDTSIGRYNGSFSVVSSPSAAQTFLAEKYRALMDPVGIVLDANGCPSVVNDVTNNTKTTTTNVPMGVFDFSGVDAFGITFGVEAYDRMTLFDDDATDWVASLDFTTSKTLSTILSELMTEMGFGGNYTVSASAVNTTLTYSENPITAYAVTYRQILRWITEAMGCSARMSRTGGVELWAWDSTSQETITPYTIIGNTRTKARYTVPQITEVVCYDTLGMNYASGSEGVPYYISANPFLTGLDTSVTPLTNINLLLRGIPVYYPSVIGQMYADPRLDAGDFVTLQTTDGTSPYVVPVMRQTLHWGGVCEATLVASGNQQRAVPSDLIDNNLSTTVNGRKILEGVDAKRITVLDEDENILFDADVDTEKVQIAGYNVNSDRFYGWQKTYLDDDPDKPFTETISMYKQGNIVILDDGWMHWASGDHIGLDDNVRRTASMSTDMVRVLTTINESSSDTGTVSAEITPFRINSYYGLGGVNQQVTLRKGTVILTDGNYTKTITADGPTVEEGNSRTSPSVASGTITDLASFSIDPGTYMITATARFNQNATGYRAMCLRSSSTPNISTNLSRELQNYAAAVNGTSTCISVSGIQTFNSTATIHLYVLQNSGSSLTAAWAWHYVRLA